VLRGNRRFLLPAPDDGDVHTSSPLWGHHLWRRRLARGTSGWLNSVDSIYHIGDNKS
jgi:hypothetical protein